MLTLFVAAIIGLTEPAEIVSSCTASADAKSSSVSASEVRIAISSDNGSKKALPRASSSASYGYTPKEPILIGGSSGGLSEAVKRTYRYLNSLRGPKGEEISFTRLGSCCRFDTKNAELGSGMLDQYEITYKGLAKPLVIYVNIYDAGELLIPKGLTIQP